MANLIEIQKAKKVSQAFGTLMSDYSQPAGEVENEAPEVEIMNEMLEALATAKRYHWATMNLGEHEALEYFYEGLEDLVDDFVETYQGFTGMRLKGSNELEIPEYTLDASVAFLNSFKECLSTKFRMIVPNRALNNIVDDMVNLVGKTLYKLTLNK
jgi:Family of unknown function (DUF5856)